MISDIEYLRQIVSGIIISTDTLDITKEIDDMGVLLTIFVSKTDMGRVIGKQGLTINAIRLIMKSFGFAHGADISVKVAEPLSI